jgi:hypothetical protein
MHTFQVTEQNVLFEHSKWLSDSHLVSDHKINNIKIKP